jgi:hypothetical protein
MKGRKDAALNYPRVERDFITAHVGLGQTNGSMFIKVLEQIEGHGTLPKLPYP